MLGAVSGVVLARQNRTLALAIMALISVLLLAAAELSRFLSTAPDTRNESRLAGVLLTVPLLAGWMGVSKFLELIP
jgi:hypothetical protein